MWQPDFENPGVHQPPWVDEVFFIVIFDSELYLQRSPQSSSSSYSSSSMCSSSLSLTSSSLSSSSMSLLVDFIMETRTKMSTTMLSTTGCRRQHRRPSLHNTRICWRLNKIIMITTPSCCSSHVSTDDAWKERTTKLTSITNHDQWSTFVSLGRTYMTKFQWSIDSDVDLGLKESDVRQIEDSSHSSEQPWRYW